MLIDNETPTEVPLNGIIRLCVSNEGSYQETDLDFESMWKEGDYLVFKSYDRGGNIVYVKMREREAVEWILDQMMSLTAIDPGTMH